MSLSDEIDKLIEAERTQRVYDSLKGRKWDAEKKVRFQAMKSLMEEVMKSLDSHYVEATIKDGSCSVAVGTRRDSGFMDSVAQWEIEPRGEGGSHEPATAQEFNVEEVWFGSTESDYRKDTYVVTGEKEVVLKLMKGIAPYLGTYRYINGQKDGSNLIAELKLENEDKPRDAGSLTQTFAEAPIIRAPIGAEAHHTTRQRNIEKWLWYISAALMGFWLVSKL